MKMLKKFISRNHGNKSMFPIILSVMLVFSSALITFGVKSLIVNKPDTSSVTPISQSDNSKAAKNIEKSKEEPTDTDDNAQQNNSKKETNTIKKNKEKKSNNSGKTWVPPVYKTVNHPAITRTVKTYSCNKGTFNSKEELLAEQKSYIRKNRLPG